MMNILKEKVLKAADIVNYIGQHVKLKRTGKDYFGLCPFMPERTPSFSVDPKKGLYKCFGCGKSGDVIDFCMRVVHPEFKFSEALRHLAGLYGVQYAAFKKENRMSVDADYRHIASDVMRRSMQAYERNGFVQYLAGRIGWQAAMEVAVQNYIGTAKDGGTLWWQVDKDWLIRSVVKIRYDASVGKRIKNGGFGATRVGGYTQAEGYISCLYNECKLSADRDAVVCIVESEKTAVIASLYIPEWNGRRTVWVASSGMNGLAEHKLKALKGRDIILVPDFAYVSRATWGALPMRKSTTTDPTGKLVTRPDVNGVEDDEYVPATQRILRAGAASVHVFDPMPSVNSGEDLADYLLQMPTPQPCQIVSADMRITEPEDTVKPEDTADDTSDIADDDGAGVITADNPFGW